MWRHSKELNDGADNPLWRAGQQLIPPPEKHYGLPYRIFRVGTAW
jgi:hypothetical protein